MNARLFSCDSERLTFLRALNDSDRVAVTDWEDKFLANAINCHSGAVLFSDRQRDVIDGLFQKYGGELNRNLSGEHESKPT